MSHHNALCMVDDRDRGRGGGGYTAVTELGKKNFGTSGQHLKPGEFHNVRFICSISMLYNVE